MFASRFFNARQFAARYFAATGSDAPAPDTASGPYFYELPRKREVMSNDERAAILTALLMVLDD